MASIALVLYPHEILTKKIQSDSHEKKEDSTGALSTPRLFETMRTILDESQGVGIAAPQVNVSRRCFIAKNSDEYVYFDNPEILSRSKSTESAEEGCLSIPDVFAEIERPIAIRVRAYDRKGKEFVMDAEGYFARIIQHEYDHLEGILFFSHLSTFAQRRLLRLYKRLHSEAFMTRQ